MKSFLKFSLFFSFLLLAGCSKDDVPDQDEPPKLSFLDTLDKGWHQISSLPSFPRHACPSFSLQDKGYIVGGIDTTYYGIDECWSYDPCENSWSQLGGLPFAKAVSTNFSFSDSGFMVGGWNTENEVSISKDVWEYDLASDSWSENDLYPGEPLQLSSSFVIDNVAYMIGGNGGGDLISSVWSYDKETRIWAQKNDFPGPPRHSAIAFSSNGNGYYGLGTIKKGRFTELILTADIWKYDAQNDSWEQVNDFPGGGRYKPSAFVIGSNCYVGLGSDQSFELRDDFYRYNSDTGTWSQIDDFPSGPRVSASSFSLFNSGFVGLGTISLGLAGRESASFSDFWVYKE